MTRALLAGALGGAMAGALDGAWALAAVPGTLGWWRVLCLALLGAGLPALAGAALALVNDLVRSRLSVRGWSAVVAVVAAPLIAADARAMFSGHRAAAMAGARWLPIVVAVMGLAGVLVASHAAVALATRVRRETAEGGRSRLGWLAAIGFLVIAMAFSVIDRRVLPRLYPWFHTTLAIVGFVCCLVSAHLGLVAGRRPRHRRSWVVALAIAAGATCVPLVLTARSVLLAQVVVEHTHLVSMAVRPILRSWPRRTPPPVLAPTGATEGESLPPGPRLPQADVILITIDALRADHVGAYGYGRPTTPHLDALAARGVRFARAYSQAPHTSFSVASFLTGKYFPAMAHLAPGERHDTLASVVRRYGWKTAAFYPPSVFYVESEKLKPFELSNFDFEYVKYEYMGAPGRLRQIRDFFQAEHPRRVFLWVHFFEPHEPYERHPEYDFGTRDVDRFDSEIAFTDAAVGELLADIARQRPGAIVIVTADHGEEFDEHGGRYHGSTLFEEQVRVPLIIAGPEIGPGVVAGPVQALDLAATILGLLDIPRPLRMRGTDLGPWLGGTPPSASRLPPVFAEIDAHRMMVAGLDKLICDTGIGTCALYDLSADPGERHNLIDAEPARAASLRARLDGWLDGQSTFEPAGAAIPRAIERARLGDPASADDLALLLSRGSQATRRESARLLATLPARPGTEAALVRAMESDDTESAAWVAVAAARLQVEDGRRRAREIVQQQRMPEPLRVRAALALVGSDRAVAVPALATFLPGCRDVALCREVVHALALARDRSAVPALLAYLAEVPIRHDVVAALGQLGGPDVIAPLVERLTSDPYVMVRAEAARVLGSLRALQARAALERAAREDEPSVAAAARQALSALPGDRRD